MKNESASKLFETLLDGTEARFVKEHRCLDVIIIFSTVSLLSKHMLFKRSYHIFWNYHAFQ